MYLLFTKNSGIFPAGIRLATWSPWNHVDLVWDDHVLIGAVSSHAPTGSWSGGVQKATLQHRLAQTSILDSALYRIDLPHENSARLFAESQVGKPYDWTGITGFVFGRDWQKPDKWFCSELAAATVLAGMLPLVTLRTGRVTPGALVSIPHLAPVNFASFVNKNGVSENI